MKGVHAERIRQLRSGQPGKGPVIYWMSREQRLEDNWALLFARELAAARSQRVHIVFCLAASFLGATKRQYEFMLRGLEEVSSQCGQKGYPFQLLLGDPEAELPKAAGRQKAGALVTDFDPLRIKRGWKQRLAEQVSIPVFEVDAHNVVPCFRASSKQEYSAATFRRKLQQLLPEFLEPIPQLEPQGQAIGQQEPGDWAALGHYLRVEATVESVPGVGSGPKAAGEVLSELLQDRLHGYATRRNDPNSGRTSFLSPYLHFGQLSAQRVALSVMETRCDPQDREAFLEQLLVRRELSDNYCWHNASYDCFAGLPGWAQRTLRQHGDDARPVVYSLQALEKAQTEDPLWNAAQLEMLRSGRMHGYMRMYWAKKILEWTKTPQQAIEWAIYLNDRYELDGRDPNGYTGILWAIGGLHDRPFQERPVFGKIRYMNYRGCARKFDVRAYIQAWS